MKLPSFTSFDFQEKRVLVRSDLDVPLRNGLVVDETRLRECLPTLKYLLDQKAKVILMGHLGRPEGKVVEELRMEPVAQNLRAKLKASNSKLKIKIQNFEAYEITESLVLLENLRFYPGEENNEAIFVRELASLGDFYVNEAFAASHRQHASIVGLPKLLPHAAGFHFVQEVEGLSKAIENPQRPLVFVIGGAKPETKLPMVEEFAKKADWVLVGGKLIQNSEFKVQNDNLKSKIILASLTSNGLDINQDSIEKFKEIIKNARTIVLNGTMGKYEERGAEKGTQQIFEAVANSSAFKIVGGGDTIAALTHFNLIDKMDYVSTAGGAMLEFLAKGTLVGIEALK